MSTCDSTNNDNEKRHPKNGTSRTHLVPAYACDHSCLGTGSVDMGLITLGARAYSLEALVPRVGPKVLMEGVRGQHEHTSQQIEQR